MTKSKKAKTLKAASDKLKASLKKTDKSLKAALKKDKKMKKKATIALVKKDKADKKTIAALSKGLKKADAAVKGGAKVNKGLLKKYNDSVKKLGGLKKLVGKNKIVKPKGKTAMSILNKLVLKNKAPLFTLPTIDYKSTVAEFTAWEKVMT